MAGKRKLKEDDSERKARVVKNALIVENEIKCPDCGNTAHANRNDIIDYGVAGKGYYFVKLCSCGVGMKYYKNTDFQLIDKNKKGAKKKDEVKKKVVFKKAGNIFDCVEGYDI